MGSEGVMSRRTALIAFDLSQGCDDLAPRTVVQIGAHRRGQTQVAIKLLLTGLNQCPLIIEQSDAIAAR